MKTSAEIFAEFHSPSTEFLGRILEILRIFGRTRWNTGLLGVAVH